MILEENLDLKANFPEDFQLESTSLQDLKLEGDLEIEEDVDENFTDFWLPPGKSLRF